MKKFITVVPLQVAGQLRAYRYRAVGNTQLDMEEKTSFPILTAINGYLRPGEDARLIALTAPTQDAENNLTALKTQLADLCARRGLNAPEVRRVPLEMGDAVAAHVDAFQKLIDEVEDDDELFACMTFGSKPLSQAVVMALQYAYRVKRNASIACVVYGGVDRSAGKDPSAWKALVYDETALVQLDEIVRMLAERGVPDPAASIRRILSL